MNSRPEKGKEDGGWIVWQGGDGVVKGGREIGRQEEVIGRQVRREGKGSERGREKRITELRRKYYSQSGRGGAGSVSSRNVI